MQKYLAMLSGAKAMKFISKLEKYFKNLPHLPKEFKEVLVNSAPWFTIVAVVLNLAGAVRNLSNAIDNSIWTLSGSMGMHRLYLFVVAISQLISAVILFYAYKPLVSKKLLGWVYIFWIMIIGILITAVGLVLGISNIFWTILGAMFGLYFIFELKTFYSESGEKAKDLDPDNPNFK